MSIYGSLNSPDDYTHEDDCAIWDKKNGIWDISKERLCTCNRPNSPIIYQGSNVLPSKHDKRGGIVSLAYIAPHVRFWRDSDPDTPVENEPHMPEHPPEPFLRFGVNSETVILEPHHVKQIRDELDWWLNAIEAGN